MFMAQRATTAHENGGETRYGESRMVRRQEGRVSLVLRARLTD
jgi:hypothetical protein